CPARPAASRSAAARWARGRSARDGGRRPRSLRLHLGPVAHTNPRKPRRRAACSQDRLRMFKRVALFLATNLAVLALASVVMSLLGVDATQFSGLLVFAAVFGMGGAFVSLLMSKWIAKRSTGARVIEAPANEVERWLLETVRRQAQQAGIGMPEVAIYEAPEINAFATGANRDHALVAVSTGLLRSLDRDQAEAVLGHEVSHVANGDMVTMALLQGV